MSEMPLVESEMTLEEFLADEAAVLQRFKAFWLSNTKVEPEHFPGSMGAGDWWEQLVAFVQTEHPEAEVETPAPPGLR